MGTGQALPTRRVEAHPRRSGQGSERAAEGTLPLWELSSPALPPGTLSLLLPWPRVLGPGRWGEPALARTALLMAQAPPYLWERAGLALVEVEPLLRP